MKARRPVRRAITLIEMIVVMILIATITGAVALNYRESLNEGKAFKTQAGIDRLETVLSLYYAEHPGEAMRGGEDDILSIVSQSPLVRNPKDFIRDGWGDKYEISIQTDSSSAPVIAVRSKKFEQYQAEKKKRAGAAH